jgi:2-polyprenyl-6-methoxyphenol hydroxylase-like FAD-dependent oxidoreductase
MSSERIKGQKAIVIGGSVAGMLAARALADFYEKIIVIEKDEKSDSYSTRKGVPQGAQGHVLLKSGEEIIEGMFPGILDEMRQNGSVESDFAGNVSWFHHGCSKVTYHSGVSITQQSRPFLEGHIQRKLEKLSNIEFMYKCKVKKLRLDGHKEIKSIIAEQSDGSIVEIDTDLVIDASGPASLTPKWLQEFGFKVPVKTEVKIDLFYASMIYKDLSPNAGDWHSLLVYPNPAEMDRGGSISPIEGDRYHIMLLGYGDHSPPHDLRGFLQYAKSLDQPNVYEAIKNGVADSEIQVYRFPSLHRYHYEKQSDFPSGLLVIGDAFCRLDPLFGQGMSIAAKEAELLSKVLRKYDSKKQLTHHFHRQTSKIIDVPWLIALTEDFRFRTTTGRKPMGLSFLQWYVKKVVYACEQNKDVYSQFIKVLHLKAHPASLFKPNLLAGVLFPSRKNKI